MKLYIAVSRDKYKLPIAVADSAGELAKMVGVTKNNILSSISHNLGTYEKVVINEEDDT